MFAINSMNRKRKAWQSGVAHATLDPDGPGVARMHLVPPRPVLFGDPPSLLVINGTWFLPVGPSWAAVLRVFFGELQACCSDKRELDPEEIMQIEQSVVAKISRLYPGTSPRLILNDLSEIVTLAVNIATNQDIPEETLKGLSLEHYSKYMTAPHRMDLLVAPMSINDKRICPLDCACCYADSGKVMDIGEPLSTEAWKTIIDKCRNAGVPMLTFTGGEPLTRADIAELVGYSEWFVTRLNTNAYGLTPELAAELRKASLDGIQITLYSHSPEIHDALVGKTGAWERTVAGIKNALTAGLSVSINTPLVERNKDYESTLRFIHSLGIRCIGCSSLIPTGGASIQIAAGKALTADELKVILQKAVTICRDLKMEISFTSPGWLPSEDILSVGLPSAPICGACLSNMAVAPTGEVIPCQSWLNGMILGNMLTDAWSSIWGSTACKSIRRSSAAKPQCALEGGQQY